MASEGRSNNPAGRRGDGKSVQQSNGLTKNQIAHDNAPFKCPLCDHSFTRTRDLRRHQETLQMLHSGQSQNLPCQARPNPPCCNLRFCHSYSARNHGCRNAEARRNASAHQGQPPNSVMAPTTPALADLIPAADPPRDKYVTNTLAPDTNAASPAFKNDTEDGSNVTNSIQASITQNNVPSSQPMMRSSEDGKEKQPLEDFGTFLEAQWELERLQRARAASHPEAHPSVLTEQKLPTVHSNFDLATWNTGIDPPVLSPTDVIQGEVDGIRQNHALPLESSDQMGASACAAVTDVFDQSHRLAFGRVADLNFLSYPLPPSTIEEDEQNSTLQWEPIDPEWVTQVPASTINAAASNEAVPATHNIAKEPTYVPFFDARYDESGRPRPIMMSILISNILRDRRTKQDLPPRANNMRSTSSLVENETPHNQIETIADGIIPSHATRRHNSTGPGPTSINNTNSLLTSRTTNWYRPSNEGELFRTAVTQGEYEPGQASNLLYGDSMEEGDRFLRDLEEDYIKSLLDPSQYIPWTPAAKSSTTEQQDV